jgi:hypothetical protein
MSSAVLAQLPLQPLFQGGRDRSGLLQKINAEKPAFPCLAG